MSGRFGHSDKAWLRLDCGGGMAGNRPTGPEDFGAELTMLLELAGLTPDEVGRQMRRSGQAVGRSSLYDWRNGRHLPADAGALLAVVRVCRAAAGRRGTVLKAEYGDDEYWKGLLAQAKQTRDSRVASQGPADTGAFRAVAATHGLPTDIASFTGRSTDLERVMQALPDRVKQGRILRIDAINGMAGIGKTTFAIHAAHQLTSRYPDGQIFVPLHGHTPGQQPVRPADALATLLLTTGLTAQQIPPGLDARQELWRERVAGKKILLVLDDATGSDQVRPLLPGTTDALVLVTSRRRLTALAEAVPITLETLTADEAAHLFTRLSYRPGLETTDEGIVRITALCGYLPLAISLMAGQLKYHETWTTGDLATDLASASNRLAYIRAENISVRAAFELSYSDLDADLQQLFRRLGLHPGSDIDAYATAALDDTDPDTARGRLDDLYCHHMIVEPTRGRYRFHDLIREYARALSGGDEAAQCGAAMVRLLDYYLCAASMAARKIDPRFTIEIPPQWPLGRLPDLSTREQALAWMGTERLNLHAAIAYAAREGRCGAAADLTAAMQEFLILQGHWEQATDLTLLALAGVRHAGDRKREADALFNLGIMEYLAGNSLNTNRLNSEALLLYRDLNDRRGETRTRAYLVGLRADHTVRSYGAVADDERQILEIYNELGDKIGQADTLLTLGITCGTLGDYTAAVAHEQRAIQLYHEEGELTGEAKALNNLGWVHIMTGDYPAALARLEQALQYYQQIGSRKGEASVLIDVGTVRRLTGNHQAALIAHQRSLQLCRELGDRRGEAIALRNLGGTLRACGNYQTARESIEQALRMHHDRHDHIDKLEKARTLNDLGGLLLVSGATAEAITCHEQALLTARDLAVPYEEAQALEGIGRCHLHNRQPETAEQEFRQALKIYQRIGSPDTYRVKADLSTLHSA